MKRQQGFTLIEIAIVLVIIGLLLGGVLKGQELITSARVRNMISQQDGIKAAYFGFLDRYRALPGDYNQATANITGVGVACGAAGNGDGNGQIASGAEAIMVWDHLSKAGFINGSYTCVDGTTYNAGTNPTNPYSMYLQLQYGGFYGAGTAETGAGASPAKHYLKTGNQVPVEIIAEVDRKLDDGNAIRGGFQFSGASATGTPPTPANCYVTGAGPTQGNWTVTASETNCGGASLF